MVKQKIMHITQATGGVKTYVAHVIDYADKNNFEFVVVAPPDHDFENFCYNGDIPYYAADLERGLNLINAIREVFNIIRVIKKEKPALLHVHSAKGGFLGRIAAKLTGTKVIYTPHAFSYLSFIGLKRVLFYLLELSVRSWTTLLLTISTSEANCAINQLGYPRSMVKVILNSIPIIDLHFPTRASSDTLNIRMIGRLTQQKNPLLFLEIARELIENHPQLQFSILGAGIHDELRGELDEYLQRNNLTNQITIEKWGNDSTSLSFLQQADVYLSTSVFEGLPFSLLEAMLARKPCVVTKVEGNTDVIQNGENGFSCLTISEFTDKLELLINDEQLRIKLGNAAHEYVKTHHNIQTSIKQLEHIYKTLL